MNKLEQQIRDNALYYQKSPKSKFEGAERSKWDVLYKTTHQHFCSVLIPLLRNRGERFVEYWPAFFLWGAKSEYKRSFADSQTYLCKTGTFATGYLCLSEKSIYIVCLSKMTKEFPRFATRASGFMMRVLDRMGGEDDEKMPIREDKIWTISYSSLFGAEIGADDIQRDILYLRTSVELWHVYDHFLGTLEEMLTGVNMGMSGKLAEIWTPQPATPPPSQPPAQTNSKPSEEVLELLKKLGELKAAGVLTETEFEQKKKELLSRL